MLAAGEALLEARKYEHALSIASQALAIQPLDPRPYGLAARALMGLDRTEEATGAAWQAVALSPGKAYYHRLLAIVLHEPDGPDRRRTSRDRLLQANAEALEAVRLGPGDPANYVVLAESYARLGQRGAADLAIRKAIELNPHSANHWATASFVAIRARNWYAAEIAARKALSIDPQNYAAINNLGVALRSRGRWMQGAVAFHGAAQLDPRSPTARENMERIGFQYLNQIGIIVLLPLVLVWPLFIAAGVGLKRWSARRPDRYRPLARRLGLWIATNKRHRRRFEKEAARAEKVATAVPADGWTSLHNHGQEDAILVVTTISVGFLTVFLLGGAMSATTRGAAVGLYVGAGALLVAGAVLLRVLLKRWHRYL